MSVDIQNTVPCEYSRLYNAVKLPAMLLIFLGILLAIGSGLRGPFVFADESVYRSMIHAFSKGLGMSGYRQYGPLYPFLVGITGNIFQTKNTYALVKTINIFFALTALIPFWKLAESLLGEAVFFWLAMIVFVLSPFWTYIGVTWAEPLFYSLFFWSVYCVHTAGQLASRGTAGKWFIASGIMCGLMFLAKPADIVYGLALIAGYVLVYRKKIVQQASYRAGFLCLALAWAALVFPFIMRNIFLEQTSALGYPYVGNLLKQLINTVSVFEVARLYLASVAYHISYMLVAGFGTLFIVYYLLFRLWKNVSDGDKLLLFYLGISLVGICLLSSVHMIIFPPYGYRIPNGRYLTQFVPVFICILFYMYNRYFDAVKEKISFRQLPLVSIVILVVLIASPLYVLGAFMIVNGPDLAVYFLMIEGKHIPWRSQFSPDIYQLLAPAGATLLAFIPFMFGRARAIASTVIILICFTILVMGIIHQSWLVHTMAGTQKQINKLFYRSSSGQMNVNVCAPYVYFESKLESTNIPFLYQYWCPTGKINYLNFSDIKKMTTIKRNDQKNRLIVTKDTGLSSHSIINPVDGFLIVKI